MFFLLASLAGHADAVVAADAFKHFSAWANTFGPLFKIRTVHISWVVMTDPSLAQQLLKKSSLSYIPKSRELYWPIELLVKPHLANILSSSDGPYWKAVRTAVAVCFSTGNFKQV